jgi:hypothetical protein
VIPLADNDYGRAAPEMFLRYRDALDEKLGLNVPAFYLEDLSFLPDRVVEIL